jgi:hypothetical protein
VLVRKHPSVGRLVNLAIDGEALATAMFDEVPRAIRAHPTSIIIWMGTNDFANGGSVDVVTYELDQMLATLAGTHARIFVINYPNMKAAGNPFNKVVPKDLAFNRAMLPILTRHHATLIDMYHAGQAIWRNPADIQQDNKPHPTAAGSVAIEEVVYAALHQAGVL